MFYEDCKGKYIKANKFVREILNNLNIKCSGCGKDNIRYADYLIHIKECEEYLSNPILKKLALINQKTEEIKKLKNENDKEKDNNYKKLDEKDKQLDELQDKQDKLEEEYEKKYEEKEQEIILINNKLDEEELKNGSLKQITEEQRKIIDDLKNKKNK